MLNNEILREAVYTSKIEGSYETVASTVKLYNTNKEPKNKSEQMPYNMLKLYNKYNNGIDKLNLEILQDIFNIINFNTNDKITINDNCLRNDYVYVCNSSGKIIYKAPPSSEVPNLMKDFFNYYNNIDENDNIYDVYCKIHWDFVKIHPFFDGNGRTARFLSHMAILKTGNTQYKNISITTEIYKNLSYYYKTLNRKTPTKFREFIELVIKSVTKRYDLNFGVGLSKSQRDFLNNSKYYSISLSKYANKYKLDLNKAIEELTELEELGFIKDNGENDYIKLKLI